MKKDMSIRIGIFDACDGGIGGAQLVVAHLAAMFARSSRVDLISTGRAYERKKLEECFAVDLTNVRDRTIQMHEAGPFGCLGTSEVVAELDRAWRLTHPYDLFVYAGMAVPPYCFAKNGLIYCHFPFQQSLLKTLEEDPRWKRRNVISRLIRGLGYRRLWSIRFQNYRRLIANSFYTAEWIRRRWDKSAEVVFPPVEPMIPTLEKRNLIISIGRITGSTRHGKYQLEQVGAFREFLRESKGGWEMVVMGSCQHPENSAYFEKLRKAARGMPVVLLQNPPRSLVCKLLGEARIFWHTAGLFADEQRHPEAAEHFGIATVEAMRAGCVPIVIDSGGQREIVQDGVNGYLCADMRTLVQKTISVSESDRLLCMSTKAKLRSMAFRGEVFEKRITTTVRDLLGERLEMVEKFSDRPESASDAISQ